jgi:hypothetical protein
MSAAIAVERPAGLPRLPSEAGLIVYPDGTSEPGVEFWTANGFVSRCVSAIAEVNLPDAERVCRLLNAEAIAKVDPFTAHEKLMEAAE